MSAYKPTWEQFQKDYRQFQFDVGVPKPTPGMPRKPRRVRCECGIFGCTECKRRERRARRTTIGNVLRESGPDTTCLEAYKLSPEIDTYSTSLFP